MMYDLGGTYRAHEPGDTLGVDTDATATGRNIVAVRQFHHARHPHEIDAVAELEAADHRRTGDNDNRRVRIGAHQRIGDRAGSPQMAEAERVVTVDENPGRTLAAGNRRSCPGGSARLAEKHQTRTPMRTRRLVTPAPWAYRQAAPNVRVPDTPSIRPPDRPGA